MNSSEVPNPKEIAGEETEKYLSAKRRAEEKTQAAIIALEDLLEKIKKAKDEIGVALEKTPLGQAPSGVDDLLAQSKKLSALARELNNEP